MQTEPNSFFFFFSFFYTITLIGYSGSFCSFPEAADYDSRNVASLSLLINVTRTVLAISLFVICCCTTFILCLPYISWGQQCFIIVFPSTSLLPSEAPL